jgi:hypothetical protein
MKPPFKPVLQKFRRLRWLPIEHVSSIGLSLFIHFLLLIVVNWLVAWPDPSHLRIQRWNFEIAFGEGLLSNTKFAPQPANTKGSTARRSSSLAPPASDNASTTLRQRTTDATPPSPPAASVPGEAGAFGAGENFSQEAASNNAENFSAKASPLNPALSIRTRMPESAIANIKLVPPKLAVSSPQRRAILKKVKAFAAKLPAISVSDSSFAWEKDGQRFQFAVRHLPAGSATGFDELGITVSTVDGGDTLSTRLRMRRLAFSQFAQFVDYWDPQVALHDDELDGRFHSNSALVISGSDGTRPKFNGKVTTAGYSIRSASTPFFLDYDKIFLDGLEEGADRIPLPRVFSGIPRDTAHVQAFAEETWITFHRDGGYTWRSASAPQKEHRTVLEKAPGCIIGKNKLHVKGIVKGLWLVYGENKIIIDDDVSYANDPENFPASGDFLGLVSAKDIEIAPPAITGPGDLKICAAILAKGRFRVPHLYTPESGTLHIFGSLSAGSISATEPRYATRIRFDKRFEKMRPPNFPMTNRYEIAEWDERWIIK